MPPAFSLLLRPVSSPFACGRRIAHQPETQRTGDRRRLDQFDGYRIAKPVGGRLANERMGSVIVTEIFVANVTRRDQTIGAGFVEFDEQAGAGDAGNVAVESRANAVGQKVRDQPVGGLAFGLGGAPLGSMLAAISDSARVSVLSVSPSSPNLTARIRARCTMRSA